MTEMGSAVFSVCTILAPEALLSLTLYMWFARRASRVCPECGLESCDSYALPT